MSDCLNLSLTNAQLMKLANGLDALDGIRAKHGEFDPFHFNSETAFKIAVNIALVMEKVVAFERAKKILAVQFQVAERMQITAENAPNVAKFMEALTLLEDKQVEIAGLEKISRASLNVGSDRKKEQNQIPPSALAAIYPLLES